MLLLPRQQLSFHSSVSSLLFSCALRNYMFIFYCEKGSIYFFKNRIKKKEKFMNVIFSQKTMDQYQQELLRYICMSFSIISNGFPEIRFLYNYQLFFQSTDTFFTWLTCILDPRALFLQIGRVKVRSPGNQDGLTCFTECIFSSSGAFFETPIIRRGFFFFLGTLYHGGFLLVEYGILSLTQIHAHLIICYDERHTVGTENPAEKCSYTSIIYVHMVLKSKFVYMAL